MGQNEGRNVVSVSNGIPNLQNDILEDKSANSKKTFFLTPSVMGFTGHCTEVSGLKNAGNSPLTLAKDSPE
jgi:hypothetical protein